MRPYVHARTGILTSEVSAGRAGRAAEGRKERRRRGRWKGDDAGTRQRQVAALLWLPAAAESARARRGASDGQGENERFLEGRGPGRPRGPAQPVGRLESERAGWGGRKGRVVRPKNDQRAAAPFHPHRYRFFQLSVQPRAERQTIKDGRTATGLRAEKVGSCGDEECVRIFRVWSATAACFWRADADRRGKEKRQHCHPRRRGESSAVPV